MEEAAAVLAAFLWAGPGAELSTLVTRMLVIAECL